MRDVFWKALRKEWRGFPKDEGKLPTPYGDATWIQTGTGGRKNGLVLGLHGGGEGAGSASEAAGKWMLPDCLRIYPQGVKLVHDTWNTVHGERFILTLIELAKVREEIDPDRVLLDGLQHGRQRVLVHGRPARRPAGGRGALRRRADGGSRRARSRRKEEVKTLQHGFVPNVRNLAMYWFIGLADRPLHARDLPLRVGSTRGTAAAPTPAATPTSSSRRFPDSATHSRRASHRSS